MNNTEVTMAYDTQKPHTLEAHRVALEAAALILYLVASTPRRLSELADQLVVEEVVRRAVDLDGCDEILERHVEFRCVG